MKLTVVGCSGSFPSPDSPASCYLVQAPFEGRTYSLVVDMGNGALGNLQRYVDLAEIDAVVLSHLHADHCLDMCGFYVARRYHPDGGLPQIPVHGPHGAARHLTRAYDLPLDGMDGQFDFTEWDSTPRTFGPFEVTVALVEHPIEAYALRITSGGRTLVYSGDTAPTEKLVEIARDADLFLCEASYVESRENPPGLHLTGAEAGEHAEKAGVGQLLLTHIPVWTDRDEVFAEATGTFNGPVHVVRAGDTFSV